METENNNRIGIIALLLAPLFLALWLALCFACGALMVAAFNLLTAQF